MFYLILFLYLFILNTGAFPWTSIESPRGLFHDVETALSEYEYIFRI